MEDYKNKEFEKYFDEWVKNSNKEKVMEMGSLAIMFRDCFEYAFNKGIELTKK